MKDSNTTARQSLHWGVLLAAMCVPPFVSRSADAAPDRDYPYFEVEGTAEDFRHYRHWRHYYWREDFTMLVRDDDGAQHRIISREPTPWNHYRLGTTYTGVKVDWKKRPRVKVIGVGAVDRSPPEFYEHKLDPQKTSTAFIVQVQTPGQTQWRDYFVNNWFHRWGKQTDLKVLPHYANDDPNYTVYGYLNGIAAPLDATGKKLVDRYSKQYGGIIYHGRVVKTNNPVGYELRVLRLMGRHKTSLRYEVFHGDPSALVPLDEQPPK